MSNDKTEVIPTVPARRSILHSAANASTGQPAAVPAHPERGPFADWRDAAPTELLPAVSSDAGRPAPSHRERAASAAAGTAFPSVSTLLEPTRGRVARRTAPTGTKVRHLRAALAGLLIAAAILIPMQLYAAAGISQARQAALAARSGHASASAVLMSGQSTHSEQGAPSPMSGQSPAQSGWVTKHTGAAYDRTNPHASPLDLPRCTTSPDTPLPCLATISPDSKRAVVLEEDASLTALVLR